MPTCTQTPDFNSHEPRGVRVASGLSLALHALVFAIVALAPVDSARSTEVTIEQSIELEALPEPEPQVEAEPEAEDDVAEEGGNGIPIAQPDPVPVADSAEPEVEAETPVDEPADEEILAVEDSTEGEVITSSDPGGQGSSRKGPAGGRGEGFGPGTGGAKPPVPVGFFRTFLANMPYAGRYDASWSKLPRGPAGRVTFRVTIKDGQLEPIQIVGPAPGYLRRIVMNTQAALKKNRLLLHPGVSSGSRLFVVDASIDGRRTDPETLDQPGVSKLGLLGIPMGNGAYFTYYSGQHVNLLMYRGQ